MLSFVMDARLICMQVFVNASRSLEESSAASAPGGGVSHCRCELRTGYTRCGLPPKSLLLRVCAVSGEEVSTLQIVFFWRVANRIDEIHERIFAHSAPPFLGKHDAFHDLLRSPASLTIPIPSPPHFHCLLHRV